MNDSPENLPLFVYGTLRPGEKNHRRYLQGRIVRSCPAVVRGRLFFVLDGGYPYLQPGDSTVKGDLVFLQPASRQATMAEIDRLEEYDPGNERGSVYLRRRTRARTADGAMHTAWVYYWNCPGIEGTPIASGDFRDRPR